LAEAPDAIFTARQMQQNVHKKEELYFAVFFFKFYTSAHILKKKDNISA